MAYGFGIAFVFCLAPKCFSADGRASELAMAALSAFQVNLEKLACVNFNMTTEIKDSAVQTRRESEVKLPDGGTAVILQSPTAKVKVTGTLLVERGRFEIEDARDVAPKRYSFDGEMWTEVDSTKGLCSRRLSEEMPGLLPFHPFNLLYSDSKQSLRSVLTDEGSALTVAAQEPDGSFTLKVDRGSHYLLISFAASAGLLPISTEMHMRGGKLVNDASVTYAMLGTTQARFPKQCLKTVYVLNSTAATDNSGSVWQTIESRLEATTVSVNVEDAIALKCPETYRTFDTTALTVAASPSFFSQTKLIFLTVFVISLVVYITIKKRKNLL